jgi:hypothetical protein
MWYLFFWSKIAIYLSQVLHNGRPSYRRSLLFLLVIFAPGSGSGSTDLTESGSETLTLSIAVAIAFCKGKSTNNMLKAALKSATFLTKLPRIRIQEDQKF